MGRQAYLTRLALGRSALQAPKDTSATESIEVEAISSPSSNPSDSCTYVQRYDGRGYAVNPASIELKRRLTHAQNDVLATVGVCAKVNDSKPPQIGEILHQQQIDIIRSENDTGLNLSVVEGIAAVVIEPWGAGLRQRLQTFSFYAGIPLATIIKIDWKVWQSMRLLYVGTPASWAFYTLDLFRHEMFSLVYDYNSLNPLNVFDKSTLSKRVPSSAVAVALKSLNIASFILLTPLEIYAALQRLGIYSAWPIIPGITFYKFILKGMRLPIPALLSFPKAVWKGLQSTVWMPLCIWAAMMYTKPIVAKGLYRYFRAVLPKPTHPNRYSLEAAEGEFDSEAIPALIDEDSVSRAEREITNVVDLLQKDLQTIGRSWQIFWNKLSDTVNRARAGLSHCSNVISVPEIKVSETRRSRSSTISTVQGLPDDLREAMQNLPQPHPVPPQPDAVLGLRPELQDLLDPMPANATNPDHLHQRLMGRNSSPLAAPMAGASAEPLTPTSSEDGSSPTPIAEEPPGQMTGSVSPTLGSSSSSPVQSRIPTPPPPIEIITSTVGTGHMHMNVTIPANIGESGTNPGFQAPSINYSDSSSDDDSNSDNEDRPYHRVTMLSAHAADTMAEHLSHRFADLLFLPLEALFVRSVAMTFWQTPGLAIGGEGAAGRWMRDVYPLGGWFGMGLRAGGWKGAGEYAGKLLLIWGMQLGVNFALWELTTGYMWLAGRRWYSWYDL